MIQNIVFDMGGVLIDFDAQRYTARFVPDPADYELIRGELSRWVVWMGLAGGSNTDEEAVASVCRRLPERLHQGVRDILDNWHQDIPPLDGVYDLVEELKGKGYGIYLLSNTCARFHSFRKNIPALRFFDGEFISADCHLVKPEPGIYLRFLEQFRLRPEACVFIDDVPLNIEAAIRCGFSGIVYHNDPIRLRRELRELGVDAAPAGPRRA